MTTVPLSRIAAIAVGTYALVIVSLLILAFVGRDEFGFSFIPLLYATGPLSRLLYQPGHIEFLPSILIGAAANIAVLFLLCWGFTAWRSSKRAK